MPICTLIASDSAESGIISIAKDRLAEAGCNPGEVTWLAEAKAVDIAFEGDMRRARTALSDLEDKYDIVVQGESNRRKMLLVSDMDSTMITVECIDELADYAGIKPQIAAITERAMAGELDFAEALRARVVLLAGINVDVIDTCLRERVRPMPGAETLVRTMTAWGAHAVLVSGGFTSFAGPVAALLGFPEMHANLLEVHDGRLTGTLTGEIVDAATKKAVLLSASERQGVGLEASLVIGDGANDLPMIAAAVAAEGLGVGYHPRPQLAKAANFSIRHNDLTALLFAQGIKPGAWIY